MAATTVLERRRAARLSSPRRLAIQLLRPQGLLAAGSVNISDGGLCLRLPEMLEVRSLVRLLVSAGSKATSAARQALECTGRVAWVVQRLDLRAMPPFLFDVGIELVNPPQALQRRLKPSHRRGPSPRAAASSERVLETVTLKGRSHTARLARPGPPPQPWQLVVFVEGVPSVSSRHPSAAAAREAWEKFKRRSRA